MKNNCIVHLDFIPPTCHMALRLDGEKAECCRKVIGLNPLSRPEFLQAFFQTPESGNNNINYNYNDDNHDHDHDHVHDDNNNKMKVKIKPAFTFFPHSGSIRRWVTFFGKSMDARNFGYDVSVSPYRLSGWRWEGKTASGDVSVGKGVFGQFSLAGNRMHGSVAFGNPRCSFFFVFFLRAAESKNEQAQS